MGRNTGSSRTPGPISGEMAATSKWPETNTTTAESPPTQSTPSSNLSKMISLSKFQSSSDILILQDLRFRDFPRKISTQT